MGKGGRGGKLLCACSDGDGAVFEYPGAAPAFRVGRRFTAARKPDLIPLPFGSLLFSMPDRLPVCRRRGSFEALTETPGGGEPWAAAAFLSSGYLRTHLPAYLKKPDARALPLWAYAGLVIMDGGFHVPAFRVDHDPRSDPAIHLDDRRLRRRVAALARRYPLNRLVRQLALCSTEYGCLCARNFFLARHEAPVPTTRACNARCLGCLSRQKGSGFCASQERLDFAPTAAEIAEVILHHVGGVESPVVSFGQGCEGEPLLRSATLARAIGMVRAITGRGTINLNTNGSLPGAVRELIAAGLDSMRVSLNSPTGAYYSRYFNPAGYSMRDVKRSLEIALKAGIFVSLNLFFLPGFTDSEGEAGALFEFLDRFPVNMLQARNLNIDPDYYLDRIGFTDDEPLGVKWLVGELRRRYPAMKIGYYNPPRELFGKSSA